MKTVRILALLTGLLTLGAAEAHYRDYPDGAGFGARAGKGVNAEQRAQHQRIVRGLERGQLTPFEYDRLARQQRHIARVAHRFKRDGHLDWRERQILKDKLARASADIHFFKRNDRYFGGERFYRD